jgi:hypothetical protein
MIVFDDFRHIVLISLVSTAAPRISQSRLLSFHTALDLRLFPK